MHLSEDVRFDIDDPSGDCSYREIPSSASALTWAHEYYAPDRGGEDLDSVFPLWTLRVLEDEKVLGELNHRHFSFMGAIHDTLPLANRTAPEVVHKLAGDRVDVVLLTPS